MEINYAIVIPVVLAAVLFVAWLVRRNMKDEKKMEKQPTTLS